MHNEKKKKKLHEIPSIVAVNDSLFINIHFWNMFFFFQILSFIK